MLTKLISHEWKDTFKVPALLFFDVFDAVSVQGFNDTFDTTVLAFEFYFSNHSFFPPYIIRDVDQ